MASPAGQSVPDLTQIHIASTQFLRKKKNQPIDLALDISSKCVGWAVGVGKELRYYGKFVFRTNAEVGEKLLAFDEFIGELLRVLRPDRLFVEKTPSRKGKTTERHLELLGVIRKVWRQATDKEIRESWIIPAITIKRFMNVKKGRNHAENKRIMVNRINEVLGISLNWHNNSKYQSDDDVADAIAVLLTAWRKGEK